MGAENTAAAFENADVRAPADRAGVRPTTSESEENVNWLRASRFCDGVTDEIVRDVARVVHPRSFQVGEVLGAIGDRVENLMILIEGAVTASFRDIKGREHIMGYLAPGDHAGDVSLLEDSPRPATMVATAASRVLEIRAADFHRLVETHPRLMRNIIRVLGSRFREFAGTVKRRPASPVLSVIGATGRVATLVRRLLERLVSANERVCVWTDLPDRLPLGDRLPPAREIGPDLPTAIRRFREDFPAGVDRHIVVPLAESWRNVGPRAVVVADDVFWAVEPSDQDAAQQQFREIAEVVPKLADRTRIVWSLDPRSSVAPRLNSWDLPRADIKILLGDDTNRPTLRERQGIGRLFRALHGYSFGLALAGGGARGMAHLGVLRAFDKAELEFDMISGASCGAMVGIVYAAGMDPDWAVEQFRRDLTPPSVFRLVPRGRQWFLLLQFRRNAWDRMLRRYLHDWRLEQLTIPAMSLTVDLVTARDVVRDRGDAVNAILESINLPGIARPIIRDGMALVDGGVLNNLPADVLADRGVDFVVGVDVSSRLRQEFAGIRAGQASRSRKAGTLETLFRVFEAQAHDLSNVRNRAVDFWITPDTGQFDFTDFTRAADLAAVGEAAANEAIPRLKQQLAEFERRIMAQSAA